MLTVVMVAVWLLDITAALDSSSLASNAQVLKQNFIVKTDEEAAVASALTSGRRRGSFVGDFCDDSDQCSSGFPHTLYLVFTDHVIWDGIIHDRNQVCNVMTQRCECDPLFPIVSDNGVCVPPLKLGERCLYDQSCHYYDRNSVCGPAKDPEAASGGTNECQCREEFQPSVTLESLSRTSICIPVPHGPWLKSDVPTVIGLGVGMSVFMALTCLVLRLFSRARFAQDQARGYGNAHLAPPGTNSTHHTTNAHSEGKHAHRHSYHRQISITESETAAAADTAAAGARRTNSISNGGHHQHSRTQGSFHGRRQSSSHSAGGACGERSPLRSSAAGSALREHQHHYAGQHPPGSSRSSVEQLQQS